MKAKEKAFTFLESIIVLGVAALLVLITIPNFTKGQQIMAEARFWRLLRYEWRRAQLRAEVDHQYIVIRYNKVGATLYFRGNDGIREIEIPQTLKVICFNEVTISPTGYTRARTQIFKSTVNDRLYRMKIQLAWGGYRLEEGDGRGFYDGR
ncbi:hypothetical protein [uncultured Limosilactobacillus sp.]|uniref:hypothetical protein n=1 Tax=uncultured Limosilactobacillus sp. TaxID=2837629 RepID=UPI00265E275D|nr:hypothetical protein [uncultured Limosilactobacillus sp.]